MTARLNARALVGTVFADARAHALGENGPGLRSDAGDRRVRLRQHHRQSAERRGWGQDGGGPACSTLDETACQARTDCAVAGCPGCDGTFGFAYCYDPTHGHALTCPATYIACPAPCSSITDEATCRTRTDCVAQTCGDCNGGSYFTACATTSDTHSCPAILCPLPCGQVTTQDACDTRTDCHSVFVDPGTCGCAAAGCCAHFSRCADGGKAACKPPSGLACQIATPYCESPYVVSYTNNCYEGCVASTECAP